MSATPETFITADNPPEKSGYPSDLPKETSLIAQFWLALSIYLGWSVLIWLSTVVGTTSIAPQAVTILLIGIGASNALFYMLSRSNVLHRPPAETIALAQAVVAIAWATLFTSMSSGAGELIIGVYASILIFALLRVSPGALNQVTLFAVISYSVVFLVNTLTTEPMILTAADLVQVLTFAGIMLSVSFAGKYVYRRHYRLMNEIGELRSSLHRKHTNNEAKSVNRRYILDLLAREKGRTDRSNVPFCVCIFTLDHVVTPPGNIDEHARNRTIQTAEVTIRRELRDMDSLSPTGLHEGFGPYSDKEYVAILPQTNLHGAQRSTQRVLAAVKTPHDSDNAHIKLSGGIAEYQRGESISKLLVRAQNALSEARSSDVSRVCRNEGDPGPESDRHTTRQASVVTLDSRRR